MWYGCISNLLKSCHFEPHSWKKKMLLQISLSFIKLYQHMFMVKVILWYPSKIFVKIVKNRQSWIPRLITLTSSRVSVYRTSIVCSSMANACWLVCGNQIAGLYVAARMQLTRMIYRKTSCISRTKPPNLTVSCLLLQWSLPNPLKPGVKLRMKMWLEQRRKAMLQLHLSYQQFYCLLRCDLY